MWPYFSREKTELLSMATRPILLHDTAYLALKIAIWLYFHSETPRSLINCD